MSRETGQNQERPTGPQDPTGWPRPEVKRKARLDIANAFAHAVPNKTLPWHLNHRSYSTRKFDQGQRSEKIQTCRPRQLT